MTDYNTSKGIEFCDLHANLIKEIGVIKDLDVKMTKKMDKAIIAFLCLIGFVSIDTFIIVWKFVFSSTNTISFFK